MSKSGLIFVVFCIVLSLCFLIPALSFPGGSADGAPGPGYFPIIVSTICIILSVILGLVYVKDKKKYFQTTEIQKQNLKMMLIIASVIILYSILFMFVPFIPLTIVFLIFLNWMFKKKWLWNIIFSIVFTLVLYFVFSKFLHVML